MPANYESIPPEQLQAYTQNVETVADEVGHEVMEPRIVDLGEAVVRAAEQIAVQPVSSGTRANLGTIGFSEFKADTEHRITWSMATGVKGRHSHPPEEKI